MSVKVYFSKVRPNAKIPTKIEENGCEDLYACFDEDYMLIPANSTRLIPTGIASSFPPGYVFSIEERGSTGSRHIERRCGIIDSGFRNEWFVCIDNDNDQPLLIAKKEWLNKIATMIVNNELAVVSCDYKENEYDYHRAVYLFEDCVVYPYEKAIAQALFLEVPSKDVEEIPYEDLLKMESERGLGMLGASGK